MTSAWSARPAVDVFWRVIDWQRPWLAPYRGPGERVVQSLECGVGVAEGLNAVAGELRFVPHAVLPDGEPYEAFIARTATVPTRDNLHDLFNGLVWLRFAPLKRRLNELQAAQIAEEGIGPTRGTVRDALTLFDENAALWRAPPALDMALCARDWPSVFITHRAEWPAASLVLFGHALLDKLTRPRKAITAHVWMLPETLAALTPDWFAAKPYAPLPVLGVPGWWPDNELAGFYDDASVFRPRRG